MPEAALLVIGLSSPLLVGVYQEGVLCESYEINEQSSDALPVLLRDLSRRYRLVDLAYANGPGSFMAIKVVYVALKSAAIATGARLWGRDGFAFNGGAPIRATGKRWFVFSAEGIQTVLMEDQKPATFALPQYLTLTEFEPDAGPLYVLDAI